MILRSSRFVGSALVGMAFGFLTLVMTGNHGLPYLAGGGFEYLGALIMILLLPGILPSMMISGNVHMMNAWISALGNFVFYLAVTYFVLSRWKKYKEGND